MNTPVQNDLPRVFHQNTHQTSILQSQIDDLIEREIIIPSLDTEDQFLSNVFLRPKPNGTFRMIIDLSDLNEFVKKEHFKMDHLPSALELMTEECFLASVDLKDAYYTVPIWENHQKFLSFRWKDQTYRFTVLPFGLSSAPKVFTKLLKPVFATLREQGISCLAYLDDSLIVADSIEECQWAVDILCQMLIELGFTINKQKSSLTPKKEITFLGYILDSVSMTVRPTNEKIERGKKLLSDLQGNTRYKIRKIATVIGFLVDLCKGVEYGFNHYRNLERQKIKALKLAKSKQFEGFMFLNDKCLTEIKWWQSNLTWRVKQIRSKTPKLTIFTDASMEGWGATLGETETGGRWSEQEAQQHINVLELRAVLFALQSFCKEMTNTEILVRSDNTTAVSYLNRMGGTKAKACNDVAHEIWVFCEHREIWLIAAHIPGVENIRADELSRQFTDNTEWELSDHIFQEICDQWGNPSIDLFASRLNTKVKKFISWHPDPQAFAIDAFTLNWSQFDLCFIFPPFSLMTRCIRKIQQENARALVVAPHWPGQIWFARLLQGGKREHLFFPKRKDNLIPGSKHLKGSHIQQVPLVAVRF